MKTPGRIDQATGLVPGSCADRMTEYREFHKYDVLRQGSAARAAAMEALNRYYDAKKAQELGGPLVRVQNEKA